MTDSTGYEIIEIPLNKMVNISFVLNGKEEFCARGTGYVIKEMIEDKVKQGGTTIVIKD